MTVALDLDAIKARTEAATPGPWKVAEPGYQVALSDGTGRLVARTLFCGPEGTADLIDAAFIAHARTDVPALVAAVEQLRADLAIARQDAREDYARAEQAEQALVACRAEVALLTVALDEAQLRSIEARNPGIDIEEVRRLRAAEHRVDL